MRYKTMLVIGISLLFSIFSGTGYCYEEVAEEALEEVVEEGDWYSEEESSSQYDKLQMQFRKHRNEGIETQGNLQTNTGYITAPGMEQEFPLYADSTSIDVTFDYDPGLDAYCKVLGMSRNELGTFRLNEGNIIELTGGGQFYLIVGSYGGAGNWTANYYTDEAGSSYKLDSDISEDMETSSGYITEAGMEEEFSLYAESTSINVTFDYDTGFDAYCKVLDNSRNELGTFRLKDDKTIELSGGGQFYLIVGSYCSAGEWKAIYCPDGDVEKDISDSENDTISVEEPSDGMEASSGYITGPGTEQEFPLYANSNFIEVTFDYDPGLDAYCKVLGMSRNELGTFRLNEGKIIELSGGGQFYLIVGSYGGAGEWTATYNNTDFYADSEFWEYEEALEELAEEEAPMEE